MEDEGGLVGVLEEQLAEHVEDDADEHEARDGDANLRCQAEARKLLGQGAREFLHETHGDDAAKGSRKGGGERIANNATRRTTKQPALLACAQTQQTNIRNRGDS